MKNNNLDKDTIIIVLATIKSITLIIIVLILASFFPIR